MARTGRLLAIVLAAWAGTGLAQAAPASGQYSALTLAVTHGMVHGVFSEWRQGNGTEAAPQFSCVFLLRGRLQGDRAAIETWYPGDPQTIPGTLTFGPGGVSFTLRENPDGCAMASGDMVHAPFEQPLSGAGQGWVGAALVTAPRAALRPAPGAPAPARPYVVRGDAVAVLERRPGWLRVSFAGGARPVSGWVPAAELAPETPPGAR